MTKSNQSKSNQQIFRKIKSDINKIINLLPSNFKVDVVFFDKGEYHILFFDYKMSVKFEKKKLKCRFLKFNHEFFIDTKFHCGKEGILFVLQFYCLNKSEHYTYLPDISDILDICNGFGLHKEAYAMITEYQIF